MLEAPASTLPTSRPIRSLKELRAPVESELKTFDQLFRDSVRSPVGLLDTVTQYLLRQKGKQIRPLLVLLSAKACGGVTEASYRGAALVELLHTATLVHDDVVDESGQRRGRATANILWDNKSSVLVGDYLFSRAFQLMVETGSLRVLAILSNASAVIAEGEVLQLSTAHDLGTDLERYEQVIYGKTAALFEAAAQVGGVISGANEDQIQALGAFGRGLGMAFQLSDDYLDYGGSSDALGKNTGDDFREGKVTLPVILAYADAEDDARAFWDRTIGSGKQQDGDLEKALGLMAGADALPRSMGRAREHADQAMAALDLFPEGDMRDALRAITEFVINRSS